MAMSALAGSQVEHTRAEVHESCDEGSRWKVQNVGERTAEVLLHFGTPVI